MASPVRVPVGHPAIEAAPRLRPRDLLQAATRLWGQHQLAQYLDIKDEDLRAYAESGTPVPQLVALRIVDLLLAESADPALTLDAMNEVLQELASAVSTPP